MAEKNPSRGGARKGAGRPSVGGKVYIIRLSEDLHAAALRIGPDRIRELIAKESRIERRELDA